MIKRRSFALGAVAAGALAAAVLSAPLLAGPARADEVEWKMHAVWVPTRPEIGFLKEWVDLVNERAAGKLKITLYPGGSLGVKDVDMLRILPPGNVIQATLLYPGYMARDVPEIAYTLPPGIAQDAQQLVDLLPTLTKIYGETYDKWGIKLLGYVLHPMKEVSIFCKDPVNTLDALAKRKLRVWDKSQVVAFGKVGVAAQNIPQNDLYVAMKTGVVDCAVYPVAIAQTISLQEVAPYSSYLFPYVLHPLTLIVSKKAYDALSADVQKILDDTSIEIQKKSAANYVGGKLDSEKAIEIKKLGSTILDPFSAEDRAKFTKASRDAWKELSEEAGAKAKTNYATVLKGLGG